MGDEDRVRLLEREVADLRVSEARLSVSVEHLAHAVTTLTTQVSHLTTAMNQGKGAARLALALMALGGGGLGSMLTFVFTKKLGG